MALVLLDWDCKETKMSILRAGEKVDSGISEGHAVLFRDVTGALLIVIPPTSLDSSTYLTVP